jgi:outer membrane protein assembly factor BamB
MWQDKVIIQYDNDLDNSALYALKADNGEVIFKQPRMMGSSWASPIVADTPAGLQIILNAGVITAHSIEDGKLIWEASLLGGDIAPSPVHRHDLVYVMMKDSGIFAVQPDGTGDVTDSKVKFENWDIELPDTSSPVVSEKYVYTLDDRDLLNCIDAQTGKVAWSREIDGGGYASPVIANGNVYLLMGSGDMLIIKADATFEGDDFESIVVGRGAIERDSFIASPAFADDRIFLRGDKNLYCVAKP